MDEKNNALFFAGFSATACFLAMMNYVLYEQTKQPIEGGVLLRNRVGKDMKACWRELTG